MDADPTVRSFCTGDPYSGPWIQPELDAGPDVLRVAKPYAKQPICLLRRQRPGQMPRHLWIPHCSITTSRLDSCNRNMEHYQHGAQLVIPIIMLWRFRCGSASIVWTLDLNYSFSHSLDDSSVANGLWLCSQNNSGPFIENPIRQRDNYASSDFDIRHLINCLCVWQMPFGQGQSPREHGQSGGAGGPRGVANRRYLPLEHRIANCLTFRRRPLGNELERPGQRHSHKSDSTRAQPVS